MITDDITRLADEIIRSVAELPDRNSPEGWPEAMIVTGEELRLIITEALAARQGNAGRVAVSEIARVGELIRTQDNRITSHPIFVVEQQRTVWAVDTDYDHDGFDWLDADGPVDSRKRARLERLHQAGGDTGKYRRLGFKHYWEFVTACFTEQGCKDYLSVNGHNLREPRTYVYSGFRNAEWQRIRAMLSAIPSHSNIEESSTVAPRASNGDPNTIVPAPSIRKRPPAPDPDSLGDWLSVEMPAGTVIGDPRWWARHIARHISRRSE